MELRCVHTFTLKDIKEFDFTFADFSFAEKIRLSANTNPDCIATSGRHKTTKLHQRYAIIFFHKQTFAFYTFRFLKPSCNTKLAISIHLKRILQRIQQEAIPLPTQPAKLPNDPVEHVGPSATELRHAQMRVDALQWFFIIQNFSIISILDCIRNSKLG